MVIYVFAPILLGLILAINFRLNKTLTGLGKSVAGARDEERSLSFYAPMERLLSEADFRFLSGRAGIPKATIRRLRSDRRRVFRKYLGYLSLDFAAITKEIRAIMAESEVSRPDLARSLFRMQFLFALAVLAIEVRLCLHACGIYTVSISASRLTEGLASMRIELRQMQALPAAT